MTVVPLRDLPETVGPTGRLLGLDVGEKTIGIASGDLAVGVATAVETIRRKKFTVDAERLFALMDDRGTDALVVGLPMNMDGTEGPRCQSVRRFADNLLQRRDVPIAFWDERLSTAAVERAMIAADVSRRKRAAAVDASAAVWILQGALDSLRR